jgi:murein DD-endopeptidase MepM/ murein hydrolase activator NlpD
MLRGRRPVSSEYEITLDFGVAYDPKLIKKLGLKNKTHRGVDFGCPKGTPVIAYRDGIVMKDLCGFSTELGNRVWLYCDVPKEKNAARVLYAHLSKISVAPGQKVKEGDIIGLSGDTGRAEGPHLHFEVRTLPNDESIQPLFYMTQSGNYGF